MSLVVNETSSGLAFDEEGFATHQVPGSSERPEKRPRLEGKTEGNERAQKMTRSTEGEEALSRDGELGLVLFWKETGSMLSFSSIGIEKVLDGWGVKRAEESDSLKVTSLDTTMRGASVSHSL